MAAVEEEEIAARIKALGDSIRAAKQAGKEKEEWIGMLNEMQELKAKFKEAFGKDYGPPQKKQPTKQEKKKSSSGGGDRAKQKEENRRRREEQQRASNETGENFGDAPIVQSKDITDKQWTSIENLNPGLQGRTVLVRGYLSAVRAQRKNVFCLVRSTFYSVQGIATESANTPRAMVRYIASLPLESVVDMQGFVKVTDKPVESSTQKTVEIAIQSFHCVSKVKQELPFQMKDACRPDDEAEDLVKLNALLASKSYLEGWNFSEADKAAFEGMQGVVPDESKFPHAFRWYLHIAALTHTLILPPIQRIKQPSTDACEPQPAAAPENEETGDTEGSGERKSESKGARVNKDLRLNYRWLDLRTPANQAIFRIESMVGVLFRECLTKKGFVEVHTPKLISGASEGGSEVFKLDYFGQAACLAMSPQLHKQIAAACSGFERVFTTSSVFRAENSNTLRHLCEFTGFDLEMVIKEHYDEVLQVFSDLFIFIFDGINERCKEELERVREQHPFEDLQYLRPTLKLTFAEGCKLLEEAGVSQDPFEDLNTENEKRLGAIVKEKYKTDFFFLDKFPLAVRPFYTMPDPKNPKLSNSYDFFIRGQEILSGAQRIHEPDLIEERARAWDISLSDIASYVDAFRHGAMPHGGGGIGLERVVMLFLGLPDIRKTAWFPRDPKRISP